ncbi:hypothetical protein U1Q18_027905, partial [Sarracenia purpurea var. burkii]
KIKPKIWIPCWWWRDSTVRDGALILLYTALSPSQLSSSSLAVKVTKEVANDSGTGALFPLPSFFSPIFSLSEMKQLIAA